ncbi:hypothetical protein ACH5RR_039583 [Cinchona calisaya]|uniref:Uncharacterized protein n=1 Tax=Cinchona calisaya TaxID=153742 RepID=A0ABD2Y2R2_9GENT
MTSWVRTISSPFRKARTFFNQQSSRDKKSSKQDHMDLKFNEHDLNMLTIGLAGNEKRVMDLHGEVMACAYEDVQSFTLDPPFTFSTIKRFSRVSLKAFSRPIVLEVKNFNRNKPIRMLFYHCLITDPNFPDPIKFSCGNPEVALWSSW